MSATEQIQKRLQGSMDALRREFEAAGEDLSSLSVSFSVDWTPDGVEVQPIVEAVTETTLNYPTARDKKLKRTE